MSNLRLHNSNPRAITSFAGSAMALDGRMLSQWLQQNSVTVVVIMVMAAVFVPISVVHILAVYVFR